MEIELTIQGEPQGKGRPKFSTASGVVSVHTPAGTVAYENLMRHYYKAKYQGVIFDKGVPLKMEIKAFYGIPKSISQKKRCAMMVGVTRPTKKPDIDNIAKIIADSLNKFAYYDDSQIVKLTAEKYYSDTPRVEVIIEELR